MPKLRYLALPILTVAVIGCMQAQPRPIPVGTDTSRHGYIAKGTKFGIAVGQTRVSARASMQAQRFRFAGPVLCQDSSLEAEVGCLNNELFDVYDKRRGLGHETVFIQIEGDRVSKIGWSSIALQLDF